jgi:hypothetical protein
MTVMHYAVGDPDAPTSKQDMPNAEDGRDARQRRIDALKRVAGMWANRKDIPADGLEYQRELRAEWR